MVLKGGFLIGAMIGINNRSTRDLDYSSTSTLSKEDLTRILEEIIAIPIDEAHFTDLTITPHKQATARYNPGFHVHLNLSLPNPDPSRKNKPIVFSLAIDISTGDSIIPSAQRFVHHSEIDGSLIKTYAYPVEQMIAEKISACINHGDQDTRLRDFYDIYALRKFEGEHIDPDSLRQSITSQLLIHHQNIALANPITVFNDLQNTPILQQRWIQDKRHFVQNDLDLSFDETILSIRELLFEAGFDDTIQPTSRPWLSTR